MSPTDSAEFAALPDLVKDQVRHLLSAMQELSKLSEQGVQQALAIMAARLQGRRGCSVASLRRKFYAWKKIGWKALVDGSRVVPEQRKAERLLAPEFVEHWRFLVEQNQRKTRPAHRELIRRWQSGEPVPGYASTPPAHLTTGIPEGWTYRNLMRPRYMPTRFQITAARIGRAAAATHRPLVFTSRVGLSAGQYYFFDDLEHDLKVNFLGVNRHAMRPLELAALDLYSGCKVLWGVKPVIENELTEKKEKLKETEMRFLVACLLTSTGYHCDGVTLCVERGTAAIREELEKILHDCSGGKIRVQRGSMEGASAFAGIYEGRGKGNFRFKAALESLHNLAHNELAHLPGQIGSNSRLNPPESAHGRDRHNTTLLRAIAALPTEKSGMLRLPFLEFHQFQKILAEVYERMNGRTDHALEGWLEAGLVSHEFRLDPAQPWLPMTRYLELPAPNQLAIASMLDQQPELSRVRRLSPTEVFQKGQRSLARLPLHCVPGILGPQNGAERRVGSNGLFEFEDRLAGPSEFRYLAQATDPEGNLRTLQEGETYLTHLNPFDPSLLFVSDAKGQYLGACSRWEKIARSDVDALHRQMGAARKLEAQRLAPLAARGAEITRQRIADARHNAGILVGESSPRLRLPSVDLDESTQSAAIASDETGEPAPAISSEEITSLFSES